jgi:hypothetical protein
MKSMIEDTRPGVKSKASTKLIERIVKFPAWEGLCEKAKSRNG